MSAEAVATAVRDAQHAADDLLLHLHLAAAASYGPTGVIDAAMADVASRADALAAADAACRAAGGPRLADVIPPDEATQLEHDAHALDVAGERLTRTIEAIEQASQHLALELARRRADIDEVLRQAAGSPGIYDAFGRTSPSAARRPRGTG